jgi:type IV pilus assembly protein PilA
MKRLNFMNTLQSKAKRLQRGQGMTEYIIIVALIAIAAIGVYTAFGGVVRSQTAVMANELAGQDGGTARTEGDAAAAAARTQSTQQKTLSTYEVGNRPAAQ